MIQRATIDLVSTRKGEAFLRVEVGIVVCERLNYFFAQRGSMQFLAAKGFVVRAFMISEIFNVGLI